MAELSKKDKEGMVTVAVKNFASKKGLKPRGGSIEESARGCVDTCGDVCNCYGGGLYATGAGVGGATAGAWTA